MNITICRGVLRAANSRRRYFGLEIEFKGLNRLKILIQNLLLIKIFKNYSFGISVHPSIRPSVHPSVRLSVCPSDFRKIGITKSHMGRWTVTLSHVARGNAPSFSSILIKNQTKNRSQFLGNFNYY